MGGEICTPSTQRNDVGVLPVAVGPNVKDLKKKTDVGRRVEAAEDQVVAAFPDPP